MVKYKKRSHHLCLFLSLSWHGNWYFLQKYRNKEIASIIILCYKTCSAEESTNNKARYQYFTPIDYKEKIIAEKFNIPDLPTSKFLFKYVTNLEKKRYGTISKGRPRK